MPKLKIRIKHELCNPEKCNSGTGSCPAVTACSRKLLEQEEAFDSPIIFHIDMCQGCGECVESCPCGAIEMV